MPRRIDMTATLAARQAPAVEGARQPRSEDKHALAVLMLSAYEGTVDYEGETLEEAVTEIERTTRGEYGPFMPEHSVVVERDGQLVSATLVTGWQGRPFIAYSMTRPEYQRRGLGRDSLLHVMATLHDAGHDKLSLVVTVANTHAHRLYEHLGFVAGR